MPKSRISLLLGSFKEENAMAVFAMRSVVKTIRWIVFLGMFFGCALVAHAETLYNFGGYDGTNPNGLVQAADGNFYGSSSGGNAGGYIQSGTLFRLTPGGVLTVLYRFSPLTYTEVSNTWVNADGAAPNPLTIGKDGNLYGTTSAGGTNGEGEFFKLTTSGEFTAIASLSNFSGSRLVQAGDGNFYGVTSGNPIYGGFNGASLFGLTPSGKQIFSYSFSTIFDPYLPSPPVIGPDGALYGTASSIENDNSTVYRYPLGGAVTTLQQFGFGVVTNGLTVGRDAALYGTTNYGGAYGLGQVFRMTLAGSLSYVADFGTEFPSDGSDSLLQASDGSFYGVRSGGADDDGVLFRVTIGSGIMDLYSFTGASDGAGAGIPLIQARDGNLYGTGFGGVGGGGTIFRTSLAGSLSTIYSFSDFSYPNALIQATDGNLYGTTLYGGENDEGTIFRLSLGGDITPLYSFPPFSYDVAHNEFTNTTGASPNALMQAADGLLYGTCQDGGAHDSGTVFRSTTGGSLKAIYSFPALPFDGRIPSSPLVQGTDGTIYGATYAGGSYNDGTIFKINRDGSYQTFYTFTDRTDGGSSGPIVIAPDGTLYGIEPNGGASLQGEIYRITPAGVYQTVYALSGNDGYQPDALILGTDGALYGCCPNSGANGTGNVFKCGVDGSFSVLYSFSASSNGYPVVNSDGASPDGLIRNPDGSLIVSTTYGGASGSGTILRLSPAMSATVLHTFGQGDGAQPNAVTSDGQGGYIGSCIYGGANQGGMIFRIAADGSYTDIHDFDFAGLDGSFPSALTRIGQTYYGLAPQGGTNELGTIFQITAQGQFTKLHDLQSSDGSDDLSSFALLAGSNGALYGCNTYGGLTNGGTVFQVTTHGSFQVLHDFGILPNIGGADPEAPLIQATDGNFYGTAFAGGTDGVGVVFKVTPSGTESVLHNFGDVPFDGLQPQTALFQAADGSFYGTTTIGGANGYGVIFRITAQGAYSIVASLDASAYPANALVQDADGSLYGTTEFGGADYFGTTFRLGTDGAFSILHDFTGGDDGSNPVAPLTLIPVASLPELVSAPRPLGMTGGVYHKIGNCLTGGIYAGADAASRSPELPRRTVKKPMSALTRLRDAQSLHARPLQARSSRTKQASASASQDDTPPPTGGTVFEQNLDGSVTPLVSFDGQNGSNPQASILAASNGYYYGTTPYAGPAEGGTAFRLSLPLIDAVGPANLPVTKLVRLQVAGSGFAAGSQIAVNGKPVATQRASTSLLTAPVTLIAYAAPSSKSVTITVIAPDGTVSNAYSLPIAP